MKAFKFRIFLDAKETIFKDVVLDPEISLEVLHNIILNSFNYSGEQMASFYESNDEWQKGAEYPLVNMFEENNANVMSQTALKSLTSEIGDKLIYVYDFLNMKIFLIELVELLDVDPSENLPKLTMEIGTPPPESSLEDMDLSDFELPEDLEDIDDDLPTFEDIDNLDI